MNNKQIDKLLTEINNALLWLKIEILSWMKNENMVFKYNLKDFLFVLKNDNKFLYLMYCHLTNVVIILRSIFTKTKLKDLLISRFSFIFYYLTGNQNDNLMLWDNTIDVIKDAIEKDEFIAIKKLMDNKTFSTINKNYKINVKQKHPSYKIICYTTLKL